MRCVSSRAASASADSTRRTTRRTMRRREVERPLEDAGRWRCPSRSAQRARHRRDARGHRRARSSSAPSPRAGRRGSRRRARARRRPRATDSERPELRVLAQVEGVEVAIDAVARREHVVAHVRLGAHARRSARTGPGTPAICAGVAPPYAESSTAQRAAIVERVAERRPLDDGRAERARRAGVDDGEPTPVDVRRR